MKQITLTIESEAGIHARPAGAVVKEAGNFTSKITLEKDGKTADAKRLLGILSLGVKKGESVTIIAEGDDEEAAVEAIKKAIESN